VIGVTNSQALNDTTIWRDLLIGGVAIAMTSSMSIRRLAWRRPDLFSPARLFTLVELEQATGVAGLMFIAVYFRPHGDVVGWQLPPVGWLFVTLGIGTALGVITYGLLRSTPKGPPFIVIVLGSICMSAGMASFLRLSVISVCFIVGLIVTSLAGDWSAQLRIVLERMGRPVFFVQLLVAGALWTPLNWRGWVLMLIVVAARFLGKSLGFWAAGRFARPYFTENERRIMTLAPIGTFAIAVIISARDLYPDAHIPVLLTAAIGCSLVGELVLQLVYQRVKRESAVAENVPAR
jgi:Kef-type K+ transport system membrane component KefB